MEIGVRTGFQPEALRALAGIGYTAVELVAAPGSMLDAERRLAEGAEDVLELCRDLGLRIAALGNPVNALAGDPGEREHAVRYWEAILTLAGRMGVPCVSGNAGLNAAAGLEDNLAAYEATFGRLAAQAEAAAVRICFENCPHGYPRSPKAKNLAFTPELFRELFRRVPSAAIGLEYDPSHLVWQQIDHVRPIAEFGSRIHLYHAKDTEIDRARLADVGIYGRGWWRFRLPGWGEIDWTAQYAALADIGYTGPVILEHEDPVFSKERRMEGMALAFTALRRVFAQ